MVKWLQGLQEYLPYYAVGIVLGVTIASLLRQTELLEDLYILAHEQRRLLFAANQRQYTAAAAQRDSAAKENSPDA